MRKSSHQQINEELRINSVRKQYYNTEKEPDAQAPLQTH
jgi:hypothetical protein